MLDWFNDDGINLPMINDHARNQFYELILADVVKDKNCVDIGFGTGLLSVIAIKHGAKHVYAYEKNQERYILGTKLIEQAGLADKITLVNEEYNHNFNCPDHITFCEIVNENLWREGLWNCLPRSNTKNFYPGDYFLEIVDIPLPPELFFDQDALLLPGVQLSKPYFDALDRAISQDVTPAQYKRYIEKLLKSIPKICQYLLLKDHVKKYNAGGYTIKTSSCSIKDSKTLLSKPIDYDHMESITFSIDLDPSTGHILLPRVGMISGAHKFYLDSATSWGPADGATTVGKNCDKATVVHHVHSGDISIVAT